MDIKKKNQEFIEILNNDNDLKTKRDELINGQHPGLLVITCSDSRVIPELTFNSSLGDIFVIRTAGNVINEGELASLEYAIEHLHIKHIILLGHTHCGAIHASIHQKKGQYLNSILNRIKDNIKDESNELEATKINVIKEVQFIKEKFPQYDGLIEGMIYDIETSIATKIN